MNEKTSSVDFKLIGRKFQSGETLNDAEKSAVFSVALEYANGLIEAKLESTGRLLGSEKDAMFLYKSLAKEVKDYVSGAILGRIVDLHDKAESAGLTDHDSQTKFAELGKKLHEKFSIDKETVTDAKLNAFIDELAKVYLDSHFTPAVGANINTVRIVLPVIVANNRL